MIGDDRGSAGAARVETSFARESEEEARQRMEPGDALRLALQERQRGERGGRIGRRDADAVDEAGRGVLEIFDELGGTRDVSAAARERFGKRAHPQFDAGAVDAGVFADAAAGSAHGSQRVRLVDEQHGPVFRLDVDEAREVGVVAVHAVDGFDGDEDAPEAVADARKERVERAPIVVGEPAAGRAGQSRALEDGIVGKDVVDDEVARTHAGARSW